MRIAMKAILKLIALVACASTVLAQEESASLANPGQPFLQCDVWVTADNCKVTGNSVVDKLWTLNNGRPQDCTKLYVKTTSDCPQGVDIEHIFQKYFWGIRLSSLHDICPNVNHAVLCETKDFKIRTVGMNAFKRGTKGLTTALAVVNQTSMQMQNNAFSGLRTGKLDLRGNVPLAPLESRVMNGAAVVAKVLAPSSDQCAYLTNQGFAADYGVYVGTDLNGQPC